MRYVNRILKICESKMHCKGVHRSNQFPFRSLLKSFIHCVSMDALQSLIEVVPKRSTEPDWRSSQYLLRSAEIKWHSTFIFNQQVVFWFLHQFRSLLYAYFGICLVEISFFYNELICSISNVQDQRHHNLSHAPQIHSKTLPATNVYCILESELGLSQNHECQLGGCWTKPSLFGAIDLGLLDWGSHPCAEFRYSQRTPNALDREQLTSWWHRLYYISWLS
jgi:hypothetical protein